ncbi:MAG: chemotaxis response regulator protein-glutamate methylesterase [Pirellulales bacterium]
MDTLNEPTTVRALVIDDSALYRKFVASVLNTIPGVEVIGTAANGRIGLEKIQSLGPDLVTLDLEMPELDGLGVLKKLAAQNASVVTIVVSATTAEGASATNEALRLGAFDFVLKPTGRSPDASREHLSKDLAAQRSTPSSTQSSDRESLPLGRTFSSESMSTLSNAGGSRPAGGSRALAPPEIVAIGVSTGGPAALHQVLPQLPVDFPCPVMTVQHMPPVFTKSLADNLDRKCALKVLEATDGHVIKAGEVLIAPGGRQMRLVREGGTTVVQITDDPPERSCKPSVDYLFRSIAHQFGQRAIGVVLTGMGDDGTLGCRLLRRAGATIVAQDEQTCTVYGMPRSVVEAGLADRVVPLDDIANCLMEVISSGACT